MMMSIFLSVDYLGFLFWWITSSYPSPIPSTQDITISQSVSLEFFASVFSKYFKGLTSSLATIFFLSIILAPLNSHLQTQAHPPLSLMFSRNHIWSSIQNNFLDAIVHSPLLLVLSWPHSLVLTTELLPALLFPSQWSMGLCIYIFLFLHIVNIFFSITYVPFHYSFSLCQAGLIVSP